MRKVNILYLDHSDDYSGGQVSLVSLLKLLSREEYNPLVGLNENAEILKTEVESLKIPFVTFQFGKISYYNPFTFLFFARKLKKVIREHKIDLLHANTFMVGLMLSVVKPFLGVPFVFRARLAIEYHGHGFIDAIILRAANLILANSRYVKKTFEDKYGPAEKIVAVYNPLDLTEQAGKTIMTKGEFSFAIIGRVEKIKRHLEVVKAAALLRDKGLRFKIYVVGAAPKSDGGAYLKEVQDAINSSRLNDYFVFTGFIKGPMAFAKNVDVCLSCTLGEALSRSIFECQLNRILVLASRSGGNEELIEDGRTGFFFEPGDFQSLAGKMEYLMKSFNDLDVEAIRNNAYQQTIDLFSAEQTVRTEETLYKKLLEQKK